jgi:hypothetical protein
MLQLVGRFGFEIEDIRFSKRDFRLRDLVTEGASDPYDIFSERWKRETAADKARRKLLGLAFSAFYYPYKWLSGGGSPLVAHSDYLVVLKKA